MKRLTQTSAGTSLFHAVNAGRRVSRGDKILFDLAAFGNLLTPRLTGQSRLSHVQLGYRIRHAYMGGRQERLKELLEPIWAMAIEQFSEPMKLGYPHARSEPLADDPAAFVTWVSFNPGEKVGVPGVYQLADNARTLIEQVWTVRRLLWRIALEQGRRRRKDGLSSCWSAPIYARPNSRIPFPLQPNPELTFLDGVALALDPDLTTKLATLLPAKLPWTMNQLRIASINRLRICGTSYRRTRSRCCRLYVALTKNQKDCSPQCRDLRLHNAKRAKGQWI